jgi:predicted N-acetyltransferase YhbS
MTDITNETLRTDIPPPPADLATRMAEAADLAAISALHRRCFGPGRFARTAYRVREATHDLSPFSRVAFLAGDLVGAIHFTPIATDGADGALLLGPLAVQPELAGRGIGARLIAEGLDAARNGGIGCVLLVGDMSYYARFGFKPVPPGRILLPGPADPRRMLACDLILGDTDRRQGLVTARVGTPTA